MSRYTDYGAGRGGVVKNQKNASHGVCSSCGKRTILSKSAWFRKSRPLCPACGGFLDPSEGLQEKEPVFATRDRRPPARNKCCVCHSNLNSVTVEDGLSVCSSALCHRAVEALGEELCAAGDITVRELKLTDLGNGVYRLTGFAKAKHARDMRAVGFEFKKGDMEL